VPACLLQWEDLGFLYGVEVGAEGVFDAPRDEADDVRWVVLPNLSIATY
jgi:hypothetical protein